jgi:hypothetical protein
MKPRNKPHGVERDYFLDLLVIYAIAHGGLLLISNAVYWDDWTIYNVSHDAILDTFKMSGVPFNSFGYLHIAIISAGPWLYKVLTFVLMFSTGALLWKIIERHNWVGIDLRYSIVLLFMVLPLNSARVALITFPYTLCYFLFFLAWYFLGKNRLLALGLFFLSFNTNSLLVFYALPMAEWYFRGGNRLQLKAVWQWALRTIDFMMLPFIFWFIKKSYFKPYGLFEGYNENFSLESLIVGLIRMGYDLTRLEVCVLLLFAFLVFAVFYVKKPAFTENGQHIKLLRAGLFALVFAVFPYCVLGHVPTFHTEESRHQLLMPLGTALLVVGLLKLFPSEVRRAAFTFMIAISLALNVQAYTEFYRERHKQNELISLMAQNDQIRKASLVVFDDRTANTRRGIYFTFEWNGLMKMAYGDETRFGLVRAWMPVYLRGDLDGDFIEIYSSRSHVRRPNQESVLVEITHTDRARNIHGRLTGFIRGEPNYRLTVTRPPNL